MKTPYLSEEWFECIRTCVAEAERIGMKAWIYDEDRWPSGAAGGLVTRDDRFKVKELHFEFSENGADAEAGRLHGMPCGSME